MSPTLPVAEISDTAFLTAYYRAIESDRPDGHFYDPYARKLAGVKGEQIFNLIPDPDSTALGGAVRTCVMDELLLQVIEREEIDRVLNVGAGLDTRPYRLNLPSSLHWIECDRSLILDYKAEQLAQVKPKCVLESVSLDLTNIQARQRLFKDIASSSKRAIALTEGVLIYLNSQQVASLAQDLFNQSQFRWWLLELASPAALQQIQNTQKGLTGQTKLQFAPEEGTAFFEQYGWQTLEYRSFFAEAQRLQRGELPQAVLEQISPKQWAILQKLSGFVLLTQNKEKEEKKS